MQGIFQKENTDKALKYGIYRHLPTYEKIIRNLVSFSANNFKASSNMGSTFKSRFLRSTGIHSSKTRVHISISCSYAFFKADHLQYEFYLFVVWQFKISLRFLYLYSTTSLNAFRGLFGGASFAAPTATIPVS